MKRIYLVRHGITEGNQKGWLYGASDIPLTPEGKEEIRKKARRGMYPMPDEVNYFSSGMLRADQTLTEIYACEDRCALPGLCEMNFGIYEARTFEELAGEAGYERWLNDKTGTVVPEGGESTGEFITRTEDSFDIFLDEHKDDNKDAFIVCHGGSIGVIMNKYFKGERGFYEWIPDPGCGYILKIEAGKVAGFEEI